LAPLPSPRPPTTPTHALSLHDALPIFASWAGQCPGNDQSAGKRRSGRTRKGSKWLDQALKDAAMAAIRTNDSYLQAQYQRLRPRSEEHTSELQSPDHLVCRLLLEKKKQ